MKPLLEALIILAVLVGTLFVGVKIGDHNAHKARMERCR